MRVTNAARVVDPESGLTEMDEGPAHWTVRNALASLRRRRRDPWAVYWTTHQRLDAAMQRLGWEPAAA